MTRVLGLESSCDEMAAAIVEDGRRVVSSVVASQADLHARFGGVVPEVASRRHVELLLPVLDEALRRADQELAALDAIAVTQGPGLMGALLVGVSAAKALAWCAGLPLVGVNHLRAHVYATFLGDQEPPGFPFICLIISGGHTDLVRVEGHGAFTLLGATRDDAAGEAFDKAARVLGLPYPGGPEIDRLARAGDPNAVALPRAWLEPHSYDFSFSGLKTAVAQLAAARPELVETEAGRANLAAGFQAAVADVLVEKTVRAAKQQGVEQMVIAGGVAANSAIRSRFDLAARAAGLRLRYPALEYCTDNAAMIAAAGYWQWQGGEVAGLDLVPDADMPLAPAPRRGPGRRGRGKV